MENDEICRDFMEMRSGTRSDQQGKKKRRQTGDSGYRGVPNLKMEQMQLEQITSMTIQIKSTEN